MFDPPKGYFIIFNDVDYEIYDPYGYFVGCADSWDEAVDEAWEDHNDKFFIL